MNILLVEDSTFQAMIVSAAISSSFGPEAKIVRACDIKNAVEVSQFTDFDLVVLDLALRDSNAEGTLTNIRSFGFRPAVVVFTATDTPAIVMAAHKAGADAVMTKSVLLHADVSDKRKHERFVSVLSGALARRQYPPSYACPYTRNCSQESPTPIKLPTTTEQ